MSEISSDGGKQRKAAEPISLAERTLTSEAFLSLFSEGMSLLEETADYLDGPGRDASKALSRAAAMVYASESMRLTTRLMQLASWLLLHRALKEGEISRDQAVREKNKVKLDDLAEAAPQQAFAELPDALHALISRSRQLQNRIRALDGQIYNLAPETDAVSQGNPLNDQLDQLASAFGARREGSS
jgi:regulator of CtrA degradation